MNARIGLALLLAAAPALAAERVVIKGSNTFGEELAPRLITEFKAVRPAAEVALESKGSGSGIAALLEGGCDIASSSRSVTEDEMRLARSRKLALRNYTIGYYGVAVIVNAANPVRNLADRQVADLFTGAVQNWKELGGADIPVRLMIRDPVSGTYLGFQELATGRRAYAASAQPFTSYRAIAEAVRGDPGAVGYVGVANAREKGLRVLTINGVEPALEHVASGHYPYARQIRLYTVRSRETSASRAFISFVRSPRGQDILTEMGFLRRTELEMPVSEPMP